MFADTKVPGAECCASCSSPSVLFLQDDRTGDVVCSKCGLVQMSRIVSELPRRVFTDGELYSMVNDIDSGTLAPEMSAPSSRRPSVRLVETCMLRTTRKLNLPSRVSDTGIQIFKLYKASKNGTNKHTSTLGAAALFLASELAGEVCALSLLLEHWNANYASASAAPSRLFSQSPTQMVVRYESELLKFLKSKYPEFLATWAVPNSVYLHNLLMSVKSDIEARAAQGTEQATIILNENIRRRHTINWLRELRSTYDEISAVLRYRNNLKTLAAVAVCILLERTVASPARERSFIASFIAPRTDIELSSLNYLLKKLASFQ